MLLIFASGTGPFGSVKHRIGDTTGKWMSMAFGGKFFG